MLTKKIWIFGEYNDKLVVFATSDFLEQINTEKFASVELYYVEIHASDNMPKEGFVIREQGVNNGRIYFWNENIQWFEYYYLKDAKNGF